MVDSVMDYMDSQAPGIKAFLQKVAKLKKLQVIVCRLDLYLLRSGQDPKSRGDK